MVEVEARPEGQEGIMADSRLTVRTLCLATVAFVLACGHAARAVAQQHRPTDRPAAKPASVIRVVPAGSGRSTIATHTAGTSGGRSSGLSRVATFSSKSGSGAGTSVVTFTGDRIVQRATAMARKPSAKPARKTPGLLREYKEPPVIAVRRPGSHAEQPEVQLPVAVVVAPRPERSGLRNAFGGLPAAGSAETVVTPARVYAQASTR